MATAAKKKSKKSGDPRVRAEAARATEATSPAAVDAAAGPTSAEAWVTRAAVSGIIEDIPLPSGNIARVRRVGPEAFLTQGIMPDTVTPIVEKAIRSKKGLKPAKQVELMKDPKQLGSMLEMLDRTLCYAVVEPRVVMPPACAVCGELDTLSVAAHQRGDGEPPEGYHEFQPLPRVDGTLYADRVDLDDKVFILNYCVGGTRDLERFRREFGDGMASLAALQGNGN